MNKKTFINFKNLIVIFIFLIAIIAGCSVPGSKNSSGGKGGSGDSSSLDPLLIENIWKAGSITAGGVKWYYFNATAGETYRIQWDDSYEGSGYLYL
jgi:hypothetical protein